MDRLETFRVFTAVADAGGFAAAARRLNLSAPAATRAVAALEERIGTRLLHRTTRQVRLTEAGTRFLADAKRILGEIDEAEASAAGAHAAPRGLLTVTAPVMFGRIHVAPVLLDFLARNPQVTGRLLLLDRPVDLIEEGLDVAVRIAELPDSTLSAVRVGSMRRVVCAAPAYLKARGVPQRPSDLLRHATVVTSASTVLAEWQFAGPRGVETIHPKAQFTVNGAEVAVAAAVAGRGLTRVLSYQIAAELRAKRLRIVLADFELPPLPVHVLHLEGRRAAARVRAFVDFAAARLRADPALGPRQAMP